MLHAREQHARIVGFKRAEGLGALSDLGGKAVQIGLALGRRERARGRKGARRCADGRIHMGGRAFAAWVKLHRGHARAAQTPDARRHQAGQDINNLKILLFCHLALDSQGAVEMLTALDG